VRPLVVVAVDEVIEARLVLEHIDGRGPCGVGLECQVEALVPPVLLGMARGTALEPMPRRNYHTASLLSP
jgi:hypothetical protein